MYIRQTRMLVLGLLTLISGCASQGDLQTVNNHIMSINRRISTMEQQQTELGQKLTQYLSEGKDTTRSLRSQSAGLRANVDRYTEEVQILNGRLETLEHSIGQQQVRDERSVVSVSNQLDDLIGRLEQNQLRLTRLEKYLSFDAQKNGGVSNKEGAEKPTESGDKNAETLYQAAKTAYDQGEFERAREGFQALLKRFSKSDQADNAQFWIGESYYLEQWYEKAILEYQKVIEKYPKGNKVPASLLKQGLAFLNLGDKSNARLILEELTKKHPDTNEAAIARNKLKGF